MGFSVEVKFVNQARVGNIVEHFAKVEGKYVDMNATGFNAKLFDKGNKLALGTRIMLVCGLYSYFCQDGISDLGKLYTHEPRKKWW